MSKCVNQLDVREIIIKELREMRQRHEDNYDFDCYEEKNPYGDTWATTSVEPTDASMEACDEEFKENFDAYDFVKEYLAENEEFRAYIENIVQNERY